MNFQGIGAVSVLQALVFLITDVFSSCKFNHYKRMGDINCLKCPVCLQGYGLNRMCSMHRTYWRDFKFKCIPCIPGETFSLYTNSEICMPCSNSCDENYVESRSCAAEHDRSCICRRGWYLGADGRCTEPCCSCKYNHGGRINKCMEDGMVDKICAAEGNEKKCKYPAQPKIKLPKSAAPATTTTVYSSVRILPYTSPVHTSPTNVSKPVAEANAEVLQLKAEKNIILYSFIGAFIGALALIVLIYFRRRLCNRPIDSEALPESTELLPVPPESGKIPDNELIDLALEPDVISDVIYAEIPANAPSPPSHLEPAEPLPDVILPATSTVPQRITRSIPVGEVCECGCPLGSKRGPFIGDLLRDHIDKLIYLFDHKKSGVSLPNWQHLATNLIKHLLHPDARVARRIERCRDAEYGGGSCSKALFELLAYILPEMTVQKFMEVIIRIKRNKIKLYIEEHKLEGLFSELDDEHLIEIGRMLNERICNRYGWKLFAEKLKEDSGELICSEEEIKSISQARYQPGQWSPTEKVLEVLKAEFVHLSLQSLQAAAENINRYDAAEWINKFIAEIEGEINEVAI